MINPDILENEVGRLLDIFYKRRVASLQDLKLKKTLKRKNPYLYKSVGVVDASEIVAEILRAHVSSSDETLFGNEFFEPLAKWAATAWSNCKNRSDITIETSHGAGVDLSITCNGSIKVPAFDMPIAVKSGVNVFNSSSKKKQEDNFATLRSRLSKLKRHYDPVVGYCYGKKMSTEKSSYSFRELAGQEFWELLTEEPDFYLRIIQVMKKKPIEHATEFKLEFDKAKNKFVKEFLDDFSLDDGGIDWDKLIAFNSGKNIPKTTQKS